MSPWLSTSMSSGPSKRAASPTPSAKPSSPLPATVVTWPCGDTRRTLWL